MTKDELIYDVITLIRLKEGAISKEEQNSIIEQILNMDEQKVKILSNYVEKLKNHEDSIRNKINCLHEQRIKKIEGNLKDNPTCYAPRIIKDGIYDVDNLMRKLEKLFE